MSRYQPRSVTCAILALKKWTVNDKQLNDDIVFKIVKKFAKNAEKCSVSWCEDRIKGVRINGKITRVPNGYCRKHSCTNQGCTKKRYVNGVKCDHTCKAEGCDIRQYGLSDYCFYDVCKISKCLNLATCNGVCYDHTCIYENCGEPVVGKNWNICEYHRRNVRKNDAFRGWVELDYTLPKKEGNEHRFCKVKGI